MKSKLARLVTSIFTVVVLLLVSCGPRTAPTTTPVQTPITPAPAPAPATPVPATPAPTPAATVERPEYGGTISFVRPSTSEALDPGFTPVCPGEISGIVYDQFVHPDWSKGLAGSGEVDWGSGAVTYEGHGPDLAESWEIP